MITFNKFTAEEFHAKVRELGQGIAERVNAQYPQAMIRGVASPNEFKLIINYGPQEDEWILTHLPTGEVQTMRVIG